MSNNSFQTPYPQSGPPPPYPSGYQEVPRGEYVIDPDYKGPVVSTFTVRKTTAGLGHNYRIHHGGSEGPVVYYVKNSYFTPGTPDVQLKQGDSDKEPILSFSKFSWADGDMTIGHGDPVAQPDANFPTEMLKKDSILRHKKYSFECADGTGGQQRRRYIWERHTQKNLKKKYVCTDVDSGQDIAYFTESGFMHHSTVGSMTIAVQAPEPFYRFLLVCWLAIREKEIRAKPPGSKGSGEDWLAGMGG